MDAVEIAATLARDFEGLRLEPYRDPAGFWTIGYGHLLTRDREATPSMPITRDDAEAFLYADLMKAFASVKRLVKVPLSCKQQAALIDFAFNLGAGNLQVSTLLRKINRGDLKGAADEFAKWVYAGPYRLAGLIRRRRAERELFLSSVPR